MALKYCGGCDPGFDRVAACEKIKDAAGSSIEWTRFDPSGSSSVLIICGCATACPAEELDLSRAGKVVVVTQEPENPQSIVEALISSGEQND